MLHIEDALCPRDGNYYFWTFVRSGNLLGAADADRILQDDWAIGSYLCVCTARPWEPFQKILWRTLRIFESTGRSPQELGLHFDGPSRFRHGTIDRRSGRTSGGSRSINLLFSLVTGSTAIQLTL